MFFVSLLYVYGKRPVGVFATVSLRQTLGFRPAEAMLGNQHRMAACAREVREEVIGLAVIFEPAFDLMAELLPLGFIVLAHDMIKAAALMLCLHEPQYTLRPGAGRL